MNDRPYGLRFQIILSLAVLITLLSGLLGFALISISGAAVIRERKASVRLTQLSAARSIASAVAAGAPGDVFKGMAASWLASGSLDGIWVLDGSGNVRKAFVGDSFKGVVPKAAFPATEIYEAVTLKSAGGAGGDRKNVFTQYPSGRGLGCVIVGTSGKRIAGTTQYLGTLLVIYLLVHGLAILVFGYFNLTSLIVRPVEKLRMQAVRLGEGKFDIEVEKRGAKEIQEVGEALSAAAARLKSQRDDLVVKIEQLEKARTEILRSQEAVLRSQKLASVGRLTAGVAHEIGNPLTSIIGFIDVLADDGPGAEERRDYLERMRKEAGRMSGIIKDLLTYARADGREISRTALQKVVNEACEIMKPQKLFKGITVERRVQEDLPPVMANGDRMIQVMVNLLLNAAEAMVGEGTIVIRLGRADDGKTAELAVEDSGPGIPAEVKDDVFEPFVTTKPEGQGTGLGLAVCHGIVRSYGGTIRAENTAGGGARFIIRLPLAT
jgi:two-component system NtrC family sensor kinase